MLNCTGHYGKFHGRIAAVYGGHCLQFISDNGVNLTIKEEEFKQDSQESTMEVGSSESVS